MKICVLQLARLGDIIQTAPALNALKRKYPNAELNLVVRHKFAAAAGIIQCVDKLRILPTHKIIEPLFSDKEDCLEDSLFELNNFTDELMSQKFDSVINLSFSPFSSFLNHKIATAKSHSVGYTRYSDGYLGVEDDISSYFFAQVGVGKFNRIHLIDIFANACGVEVIDEDFMYELKAKHIQNKIIFHVGASTEGKAIDVTKSKQILRKLNRSFDNEILLVGSAEEVEKSKDILSGEILANVTNLVGKTQFKELFNICSSAKVIIGPDSLFMQLASVLGVPAVNVSFESVNFWETGPISHSSRIIQVKGNDQLMSDDVLKEVKAVFQGEAPSRESLVSSSGHVERFTSQKPQPNDFEWQLIQALYMGESYPINQDKNFHLALKRLKEVVDLSTQQLSFIKRGINVKQSTAILEKADSIIRSIGELVSSARPIVSWYEARKVMIPPGSVEQILVKTQMVVEEMDAILSVYINDDFKCEVANANN